MIIKKHDHRQYRVTACQNGLKVLLVHDARASQSAIAISVETGHFQDPTDCPGLAHLLEHCLFAGCKDYPEENLINKYIESYGGHINAWTAAEMTGFNIDCQHNDFFVCNNMLASMLSAPLFPDSCLEKEISAIDSEYKLKFQEDLRRIHQVDKETSNQAHPFHKFSVGCAEVYNRFSHTELVEKLKIFHQQHYRAASMRLCIISPASLEQMEKEILPLYEQISSDPYVPIPIRESMYKKEQLGQMINIVPMKDMQSLALSFALPDIHSWYRTKPEAIISAMLGDEEEGSLLRYFKQQNWVTHLAAGSGIQGSNFKDYTVVMQLTNLGIQVIPKILEAFFYYVQLIKEEGFPDWRFEERQRLNQLTFEFQEDPKAGNYASHLSIQMHHYPEEHFAFGEYVLDDFNTNIAQEMLGYLTPDYLRIKLVSKNLATSKTTYWYETPYSIEPISTLLEEKMRQPAPIDALHLPKPNQFLPTNLTAGPIDRDYLLPQKIATHANGETWFGQDIDFNQPKAELFISFESCRFNHTPEATAYTRIWTSAIQSYINDNFYSASVAGVFSHIYPHKRGVTFHSAGFSEKQLDIAKLVLCQIANKEALKPYFEQTRAQRLKVLNNSVLNKPVNRLFATLNTLMHEYSFLPEELVERVAYSNLEQVQKVTDIFCESYWQLMLYGNWSLKSAHKFDDFITGKTGNKKTQRSKNKVLDLSELQNEVVYVRSQHSESALVHYLQGLGNSLKDKAICIIIEQLISPVYFQFIRQEKQFGYQLGCGYLPFLKAPGIALYVQSPVVGADTLYLETLQFLQTMPEKIKALPQEGWNKTLSALSRQFGAQDQNLSMKCQRLWTALDNENQAFDEHALIIQNLQQISQHETADYLSNLLNRNSGNLSLLSTGDKKISLSFPKGNLRDVFDFRLEKKAYI